MKTVRFLGVLLISIRTIFISSVYCNYFPIKDAVGSETNDGDNKYSPAGKWLSIKNTEASQGEVTLFVPDFIINCHSRLLDPGAGLGQYNDVLVYTNSRKTLYKDLFLEIMLMTTSGNHQFEFEISKPLNSSIKEVNYTIKMLGEIKVIPKSSNLFKELPVQLKLVDLLFTVQDKVNEAGAEAASIYTSLLAFRDFRYKFLKSQITNNRNYDPEMLVGLELAYNELIGMQTKELASLKKQLETNSGLESASGGLVKMAIGIQFGKVVSAIAGDGLLGVSLATAASTAWFWQLDRTYDAKKAEASVVLLSSIDQTLFESIKPSVSPADIYSIEQMHTHLSIMTYEAANVYNNKSSVQYNFKLPMRDWINGFPYYDISELALMKQKAINDIEILPPDKDKIASNSSGFFIDPRDGHKYKTVRIGNQVWMAENLAYKALKGCYSYGNNPSNIEKNGYLYDRETALKVCPTGWHLSTNEDWKVLEKNLGADDRDIAGYGYGINLGAKIKSSSGWKDVGNGSNSSGFNALPSGGGNTTSWIDTPDEKSSPLAYPIGETACWWTNSFWEGVGYLFFNLSYKHDKILCFPAWPTDRYSVRCINNISGNSNESSIYNEDEINLTLKNSKYTSTTHDDGKIAIIILKDGRYSNNDDNCYFILDNYKKTNFTGKGNEFLVSFLSGCGNSAGYEHKLIILKSDKTIQELGSFNSYSPITFENNIVKCSDAEWDKNDSHCCPSWEIKRYLKWNGSKFIQIKAERSKKNY
jgi:uncharacterized protein (TIGR02145 family)